MAGYPFLPPFRSEVREKAVDKRIAKGYAPGRGKGVKIRPTPRDQFHPGPVYISQSQEFRAAAYAER